MNLTLCILSLMTSLSSAQGPPVPAVVPEPAPTSAAQATEIEVAFPPYAPVTPPCVGIIHIAGSDTMAPALSSIAEAFTSIYPDCNVTVRGGGSEFGLAELAAQRCDFAAVSRVITPQEKSAIEQATKKSIIQITIASDAVCVYVNADNPLKGMTRTQLNGAFSISHTKTKTPLFRWNEIDPNSPLGDAFVRLHVCGLQSGTMTSFTHFAMPGERFTTSLCFTEPAPSSVVNACCAYKNALGVSGFVAKQPRARALAISASDDGPFVQPTSQTIYDGSYPLSRPLTFVAFLDSQGKLPPEMIELLRYIFSETGQDILTNLNFVALHPDQLPALIKTPSNAP